MKALVCTLLLITGSCSIAIAQWGVTADLKGIYNYGSTGDGLYSHSLGFGAFANMEVGIVTLRPSIAIRSFNYKEERTLVQHQGNAGTSVISIARVHSLPSVGISANFYLLPKKRKYSLQMGMGMEIHNLWEMDFNSGITYVPLYEVQIPLTMIIDLFNDPEYPALVSLIVGQAFTNDDPPGMFTMTLQLGIMQFRTSRRNAKDSL